MSPSSNIILLVEDDPDLREAVADTLAENGYEILTAENGQQALEVLDRAPHAPCVILLDLMMPVMDGWRFREEQRRRPELANIPVVALTAHGDLTTFDAVAHLRKPVSIEALLNAVARYCGGTPSVA